MSKVIVITGASAGIGAEFAKQLAARGDQVMLAARNEENLNKVAQACGKGAAICITDVTHRADIVHLRDEAIRTFGHIDVWVNNAGRGITRSTLELTDEDFDDMMTVNVKSALYGMQTIIPYFKERGAGQVINVSSFLGRIPFATFRSVYSAAKSALNSLTANVRMDLRAEFPNIHVSLVIPGVVSTEFSQNALHSPGLNRSAPNAQTAEDVAAVMVDVIDHPRAEVYTNPSTQIEQIKNYYTDVAAFEANARR